MRSPQNSEDLARTGPIRQTAADFPGRFPGFHFRLAPELRAEDSTAELDWKVEADSKAEESTVLVRMMAAKSAPLLALR